MLGDVCVVVPSTFLEGVTLAVLSLFLIGVECCGGSSWNCESLHKTDCEGDESGTGRVSCSVCSNCPLVLHCVLSVSHLPCPSVSIVVAATVRACFLRLGGLPPLPWLVNLLQVQHSDKDTVSIHGFEHWLIRVIPSLFFWTNVVFYFTWLPVCIYQCIIALWTKVLRVNTLDITGGVYCKHWKEFCCIQCTCFRSACPSFKFFHSVRLHSA